MADWKNAADYKFPDAQRRERWVWEFMRRNTKYRADFASVPTSTKKQLDTLKEKKGLGGARPAFPPAKVLGRTWLLDGPIQDPADDSVPVFRFPIPGAPLLSQLVRYYEEPDDEGWAHPRPHFSVLVFHLDQDLESQLKAASRMLKKSQKALSHEPEKRNLRVSQFRTYLRVLDAKSFDPEPSTEEIVTNIAAYKSVAKKTTAEWEYAAQKRVLKDFHKAEKLVANPWSILFEHTSPISSS